MMSAFMEHNHGRGRKVRQEDLNLLLGPYFSDSEAGAAWFRGSWLLGDGGIFPPTSTAC